MNTTVLVVASVWVIAGLLAAFWFAQAIRRTDERNRGRATTAAPAGQSMSSVPPTEPPTRESALPS